MKITIFVQPESFAIFLVVMKTLEPLKLDNNYVFQPKDIVFSEAMVSNWMWITLEMSEYVKLKYCMGKLSK